MGVKRGSAGIGWEKERTETRLIGTHLRKAAHGEEALEDDLSPRVSGAGEGGPDGVDSLSVCEREGIERLEGKENCQDETRRGNTQPEKRRQRNGDRPSPQTTAQRGDDNRRPSEKSPFGLLQQRHPTQDQDRATPAASCGQGRWSLTRTKQQGYA